jgi:hypothetical protein
MSFESEKEFRESLGFKDEVVYHYCSLDALYGILSSKSLWLTALESSNDKLELQLARKILQEALDELISEELSAELGTTFKKIQAAPTDQSYKKYRPNYKYYGLSLVKDNDSLPHWERYANKSTGVCIGINISLMRNMFFTHSIPDILSNWLQTTEIIYSYEKQVNCAKDLLLAKIAGFQDIYKDIADIENIYSTVYYSTLATLKPRFKHKGFSSEEEYRIYLEEGQSESAVDFINRNLGVVEEEKKVLFMNLSKNISELSTELRIMKSDKNFGVFADGIRSYYALSFEEVWSDVFIQEIILGPKCFQNKRELKSFMKSCGLDRTKVLVSKIPLR